MSILKQKLDFKVHNTVHIFQAFWAATQDNIRDIICYKAGAYPSWHAQECSGLPTLAFSSGVPKCFLQNSYYGILPHS